MVSNKIEFFNINSQIKINMTGGNVKSGIYGGSNVTGIVYGSTELNIKMVKYHPYMAAEKDKIPL